MCNVKYEILNYDSLTHLEDETIFIWMLFFYRIYEIK